MVIVASAVSRSATYVCARPSVPAPEDFIDQEPVARLHREGFFRGLVGLA